MFRLAVQYKTLTFIGGGRRGGGEGRKKKGQKNESCYFQGYLSTPYSPNCTSLHLHIAYYSSIFHFSHTEINELLEKEIIGSSMTVLKYIFLRQNDSRTKVTYNKENFKCIYVERIKRYHLRIYCRLNHSLN